MKKSTIRQNVYAFVVCFSFIVLSGQSEIKKTSDGRYKDPTSLFTPLSKKTLFSLFRHLSILTPSSLTTSLSFLKENSSLPLQTTMGEYLCKLPLIPSDKTQEKINTYHEGLSFLRHSPQLFNKIRSLLSILSQEEPASYHFWYCTKEKERLLSPLIQTTLSQKEIESYLRLTSQGLNITKPYTIMERLRCFLSESIFERLWLKLSTSPEKKFSLNGNKIEMLLKKKQRYKRLSQLDYCVSKPFISIYFLVFVFFSIGDIYYLMKQSIPTAQMAKEHFYLLYSSFLYDFPTSIAKSSIKFILSSLYKGPLSTIKTIFSYLIPHDKESTQRSLLLMLTVSFIGICCFNSLFKKYQNPYALIDPTNLHHLTLLLRHQLQSLRRSLMASIELITIVNKHTMLKKALPSLTTDLITPSIRHLVECLHSSSITGPHELEFTPFHMSNICVTYNLFRSVKKEVLSLFMATGILDIFQSQTRHLAKRSAFSPLPPLLFNKHIAQH